MKLTLAALLLLFQDVNVGRQIRKLFDCGSTVVATSQDVTFVVDPASRQVVHQLTLNAVSEGEKVVAAGSGWIIVATKSAVRGFDPSMKTKKWETKTGSAVHEGMAAGSSAILMTLEGVGGTSQKVQILDLATGQIRGSFSVPMQAGQMIRADASRIFVFPKTGGEVQAYDHSGKKLWGASVAECTRVWASPKGIAYYKPEKVGNTLRVFDPATGKEAITVALTMAEGCVGVSAERVYISASEVSGGARLRAHSLKDGKELWKIGVPNSPRQVIEAAGVVCAISATRMQAYDLANGAKKWELRGHTPFHLRNQEYDEIPVVGGKLALAEFNEQGDPIKVFLAAPDSGQETEAAAFDEEPFAAAARDSMLLVAVGSKIRIIK
jgi:hypothetical protein